MQVARVEGSACGDRGEAPDARTLGVLLALTIQLGLQAGNFLAQHRLLFNLAFALFLLLLRVGIFRAGLLALRPAGGGHHGVIPSLSGGAGLNLWGGVDVPHLGVGKLRFLLGGELACLLFGAAGLLVVLCQVIRLFRSPTILVVGQGHIQSGSGLTALGQGERHPEDQKRMDGQGQKQGKAQPITRIHGVVGERVLGAVLTHSNGTAARSAVAIRAGVAQ